MRERKLIFKMKGGKKMVRWFKVAAGAVGVLGVAWSMPTDVGSWLIGLAFLIIAVSGFAKKK
jgi:hypothetical protein